MPSADTPPIAIHAPGMPAVDAYAAIASAYVYRGVALRDRPTASFAVSARTGGWFVDLWNGLVDDTRHEYDPYYHTTSNHSEWDIDVSAGYGAALGDDWQWSLAGAHVVNIGGSRSNDYTEWRANLFYRDALRGQIAYSDDYLQAGHSSWNAEVSGSPVLTDSIRGEWGLGHSRGAGGPSADYQYGWLGLSGFWLRTHWDMRWVDAGSGARYVADSNAGGSRVVVSLSWALRLSP